jgi:anti-anti-sigma factor
MTFELDSDTQGTVVVRVRGELDISNVARLESAVAPILENKPGHLLVDVGDLRFADTSAIAVWVRWATLVPSVELRKSLAASAPGDYEDGTRGNAQDRVMTQTRHFPARPESVAARHFATEVLGRNAADVRDAVQLMVSELATNCVQHARTAFDPTIRCARGEVRVEVTDSSMDTRQMRSPGPEEPSGRGLQIVSMLSQAWGWSTRARRARRSGSRSPRRALPARPSVRLQPS